MKIRLLSFLLGVLFTAVLFGGVLALRAQGDSDAPKWEYGWVSTDTNIVDMRLHTVSLNGQPVDFSGNTFQLFNALGADGWEYVERNGSLMLFKRPIT